MGGKEAVECIKQQVRKKLYEVELRTGIIITSLVMPCKVSAPTNLLTKQNIFAMIIKHTNP